jgi:NitT/TauT family transport system ATP-binding protein
LHIRRFYGPDGRHAPKDQATQRTEIDSRVSHWLERLGISKIRDQYPAQISGGQRQRTAIARTLAMNPDLLLMDEPFSSLDALTREDLERLTLELRKETGLTTVIVTHNIEEAVYLGQRILLLRQPPNLEPMVLENPEAGEVGYREKPRFQARCTQLRDLLGETTRAQA